MLVAGLILVIAVWVQLWITVHIAGYWMQALSAIVTVGLTIAAVVMLFRSLRH